MRIAMMAVSLLILQALNACASEPMQLRMLVVDAEMMIAANDVDDVVLRYDRADKLFYAVVSLNETGRRKVAEFLKTSLNKQLLLYAGDRILSAKIPIKTERVSSIMLKFKDAGEGAGFLEAMSK